ncbi:CAP domain-containing protein [Azohydromonas caseinilytica]|uniref:CAP domain-containing protein n=1 Tax=Azohydromonas caseinilytica TaxID=2728836 RepID=A0A848FBW8_9BURK|nr:CAP domain-containing protein [Azohydromonas caseinilytica]NML16808.1 CAP domain-containing protein [Azohydromonas caseinilytica]
MRTPRRLAWALRRLAAAAAAGTAALAGAAPAQDFVRLLNEQRARPQLCGPRQLPAAALLVERAELALAEGDTAEALRRALGQAGFPAARVQWFTVSGPRDARQALALLRGQVRACEALAAPEFSAIGVRQEGSRWRIVMAQPLLAPDLGDWREAGRQVLALANAARAQPRRCGAQLFAAAPPLRWNDALGTAAQAHSADMARRDYFEHRSPEGSLVNQRALRAGYAWRRIGENIAFGMGAAPQAVQGWLDSPGHCRNLMDPAFTEMGAAYAVNPASGGAIYWTQVLAHPR